MTLSWLALLAATACGLSYPGAALAGECLSAQSDIVTDRPTVANSSLAVPTGSFMSENGINTSDPGSGKTFDGTNSRLRFGVAPCLELLVDLPTYVGRLSGSADTGFTNLAPAVKWQVSGLPQPANMSLTFGLGLPTGTPAIAGDGLQPYLQLPWSYDLPDGWSLGGMFTSYFHPSDLSNHQTSEATFVIQKKVTEKMAMFAEYVGDYPSRGASTALLNLGGTYLLNRTEQLDFHLAFGLNRNSPNYIVGVGYSFRLDHVLGTAPARATAR